MPLDPAQITLADVIAVMERAQLARLKRRFGPMLRGKRIVCLDVPDRIGMHDPGLVDLLTRRFNRLASGADGGADRRETG